MLSIGITEFFWDWVYAALMPRMAFGQSFYDEVRPAQRAEPLNGCNGVS
jgi:hypothetical protein